MTAILMVLVTQLAIAGLSLRMTHKKDYLYFFVFILVIYISAFSVGYIYGQESLKTIQHGRESN
jgi:hypothetical protein